MIHRSISAILLALILALTGQGMAVARGASAATGQMILCTGSGPFAIYVDEHGKQTSAPHICPDASLNIPVTGPVALLAAPARLIVLQSGAVVRIICKISQRKEPMGPRGPPASV